MNRIAEILRDSNTPLIIVKKVGETASAEATLNAFADGGEGYAIISNSDEIHSPTSGEKLTPVEGLSETVQSTDFSELSEMEVSGEASYTLLVDPDLAFDLAGETFKSPVDGKDITVSYKEVDTDTSDNAEENAEDESEEDDSSDDTNTDIEEDLDSGVEEVEEDEGDLDVDADVDSELEGDDEGTEGDDSEGLEETDESSEDIEEASEETVAADATLVLEATHDNDKPLRLVQMDEKGTEVAAFSGSNYIGSLTRSKAASNVQPLFDNGAKLFQSFKLVLSNSENLRTPEVASFGFEPVVHKVEVAKFITDAIESAKATATAEVASSSEGFKERFKKVLNLSTLGINKGFFEGANPLVSEVASVLKNAGVKNPETVVRRALAKASEKYSSTIMEKASELIEESDDFLRGVSQNLTNTEFKADEVPENLTTLYVKPEPETRGEVAGFRSNFKQPTKNRFAGIVGGLGRR